jgi:uncharacterized glyoxalase superfamily protein PhnB
MSVVLTTASVEEARRSLLAKGVEISEIDDQGGGVKYAAFKDPEGNSWTLQEMAARAHGWS